MTDTTDAHTTHDMAHDTKLLRIDDDYDLQRVRDLDARPRAVSDSHEAVNNGGRPRPDMHACAFMQRTGPRQDKTRQQPCDDSCQRLLRDTSCVLLRLGTPNSPMNVCMYDNSTTSGVKTPVIPKNHGLPRGGGGGRVPLPFLRMGQPLPVAPSPSNDNACGWVCSWSCRWECVWRCPCATTDD
jgi:hypothetical protein